MLQFDIVKATEVPARESKGARKGAGDQNKAFLNALEIGQVARIDPAKVGKAGRGILGGLSRAARELGVEVDAYQVGGFIYVQRLTDPAEDAN